MLGRKRNVVCAALMTGSVIAVGVGLTMLQSAATAQQDLVDVPMFEVDPFWPKPLPNHWVLGNAIGVWVDEYPAANQIPDADVINVGYYRAVALGGDPSAFDPAEISEVGWFAWDELPRDLAPPGTLEAVLAAVRDGSPLADRPR